MIVLHLRQIDKFRTSNMLWSNLREEICKNPMINWEMKLLIIKSTLTYVVYSKQKFLKIKNNEENLKETIPPYKSQFSHFLSFCLITPV